MKKAKPIDKRTYKYKNPALSFFCPLCGMERSIKVRPRLRPIHFLQMAFVTALLCALSWKLMGFGSLIWFFIVWAIFEAVLRVSFKKEVPCPHCGFDATWYKKDVKVARKKVAEFWEEKNSDQVSKEP